MTLRDLHVMCCLMLSTCPVAEILMDKVKVPFCRDDRVCIVCCCICGIQVDVGVLSLVVLLMLLATGVSGGSRRLTMMSFKLRLRR